MVFCTYCGHSFTRDEHLERHILTHTNVKPFKCFTCHMSFARRDLLQRHYTVHGRNQDQDQQEIPAANGMMLKSAGRTPIACSNCAKTKTKCDKKFPCSRCASRNLKCTLRPTRRSTKNAARMGLITPETLAAGVLGVIPPDQTIAAETVPVSAPSDTVDAQTTSPSIPPLNSSSSSSSSSSSPRMCCSSVRSSVVSLGAPSLESDYMDGCITPPNPTVSSPAAISGGDSSNPSPFTPFDEFGAAPKDFPRVTSTPHFMLDWQQLQMPLGYDHLVDTEIISPTELGFDVSAMALEQIDPALAFENNATFNVPAGLMPLKTPTMTERTDPSMLSVNHSRHASMVSCHSLDSIPILPHHVAQPRIDPVLAAQACWTSYQCVPPLPAAACPTTARWNLEALESSLRDHDGWSRWMPELYDHIADSSDHMIMKLHESSRDKLLAITQGFLHKALEIHRGAALPPDSSSYGPSNFVLLPPANVLEYFLRSYTTTFERYYPISSRNTIDINGLMHCFNDQASSLLVLLMLAQGALTIPSAEARALTLGLVETCRISLFDLIERNVHMASEPNVLHAALIFTSLAAWGGDKWQMDIAMGQRGIYTAMLRHSGMLTGITSAPLPANDGGDSTERLWSEWLRQESQSRLVHAWAMIDQELALFNDTAPLLSITEFEISLPHSDGIWKAKTASEWSSLMAESMNATSSSTTTLRPSSLRDLFRRFLDDEMASIEYPLTPLHLRLLLHALQSMVCHYSQLMSCFSDSGSSRAKNKAITASSTRCRVEEVQCLLQRWYNLADSHQQTHGPCAMIQTSLVIYHLISLNTATDFSQIEQLARRETFDGTYQSLIWAHKRCITDVGEAVFHCGQVLRILRLMPRASRPSWWPAAIYRTAMILWCDSLINKDGSGTFGSNAGQTLAVDGLPANHPAIMRYLNKGEGIPCLTKSDGSTVAIDHGIAVLDHCIGVLDEGIPTRFHEGIRAKLDQLMRT